MLEREEAERKSVETQLAYSTAAAGDGWLMVTEALQLRVVGEFLPSTLQAEGLAALRAARLVYPEDPAMSTIPCYVRHNRAAPCPLNPPCAAPDVPLFLIEGAALHATSLHRLATPRRPTLLLAGSVS
mmetsp:Transcript_14714/g.31961  ORF Transcript_14714/g.31961 Transcript_14714/m.31961 type:complete len:128 (-) Transcript_14714:514-897(-)